MNIIKAIWHKSFIYNKFLDFVEAKSEKTARQIACKELWDFVIGAKLVDKLKKDLGDDLYIFCYADCILSEVIFKEKFEVDEIAFVRKFLRKGDVFVDIGSNIGLFSLIAGKTVQNEGKVLAVEPYSKSFNRLNENIELNDLSNVIPVKLAVSNEIGEAKLQIAEGGYDAWNSLVKPTAGISVNFEIVNTVTMDELQIKYPFIENPRLVKIDVEGWEINLLKGCYNYFNRADAPDLFVEFTEENAQNAGGSCKELYYLLVDLGYKLYVYDFRKNKLVPHLVMEKYIYCNVFATKSIKSATERLKNK